MFIWKSIRIKNIALNLRLDDAKEYYFCDPQTQGHVEEGRPAF